MSTMSDGISAGAPANYWPELNALHAEFGRFLVENRESWVSPGKLAAVQDAVQDACGAICSNSSIGRDWIDGSRVVGGRSAAGDESPEPRMKL